MKEPKIHKITTTTEKTLDCNEKEMSDKGCFMRRKTKERTYRVLLREIVLCTIHKVHPHTLFFKGHSDCGMIAFYSFLLRVSLI